MTDEQLAGLSKAVAQVTALIGSAHAMTENVETLLEGYGGYFTASAVLLETNDLLQRAILEHGMRGVFGENREESKKAVREAINLLEGRNRVQENALFVAQKKGLICGANTLAYIIKSGECVRHGLFALNAILGGQGAASLIVDSNPETPEAQEEIPENLTFDLREKS